MRSIVKTFIACCLIAISSNGQGINNLWLMGYGYPQFGGGGITMDFKYGFDSIYFFQCNFHFESTNACIADGNGQLLFYTNGYYINNAHDELMLNSNLVQNVWTQNDSLGVNSEQGALILPMPGSSTKYYLFHGPWNYLWQDDWFYSVIDMSLDSGKGAVTTQNQLLWHDTLVRGKINACRHANGRDWWIVFPKHQSNIFYLFLITPYGISGPYTQSIGSSQRISGHGQTCFSRDGKRFAYYDPLTDLDLVDFDRCSGTFSNLIHVDIFDSADIGGVAFSPDNNVLYVSSNTFIYQFDLTSANIPQSQMTVAVWDTFYSPQPPLATTFYLSWLAPDDKIYIVCGNGTLDFHRINNPDSIGLSCDVAQHSIHLPAYNAFTIPHNVNYFLGADTSNAICDSINNIQRPSFSNDLNIEIYPNPNYGILYIKFTNEKDQYEISVFNILGERKESKEKWLKQYHTCQLDISDLSSGIYYLEIVSGSEKVVKKIIKD